MCTAEVPSGHGGQKEGRVGHGKVVRGSLSPELSRSGMLGPIKCPLQKESVSSTENILAFLDL